MQKRLNPSVSETEKSRLVLVEPTYVTMSVMTRTRTCTNVVTTFTCNGNA